MSDQREGRAVLRVQVARAVLALGLLLLSALAVGCGSSHGIADPKTLGLTKRDVPKGFKVYPKSTHVVTNAQSAHSSHISLAILRRKGRISGYETQYQRSDAAIATVLPPGVVLVDSQVSSWKSADGAHWNFRRGLASARAKKFHVLRVPGSKIGDEEAGLNITESFSGQKVIFYLITFRRGQYFADITIAGSKGTIHIKDAIPYARAVDQHIRQQG